MDHSKPKGKLVCVCNQAVALSVCRECPKGNKIKPDETYYWSTWDRKINKFVDREVE